jgi:cytochrome d ubiquinol oxidase subunit II
MALLLGVALGNIARGIPITADREFAGSFLGLLNPYALLVGLTTVALFVMHGGIYLQLKTEGELLARLQGQTRRAWTAVAVLLVVLTTATLATQPHLVKAFKASPVLFGLPVLVAAALAYVRIALGQERCGTAFVASAAVILGLMLTLGVGLYPRLVPSLPHPEHSLTAYNAASSPLTLKVMLIIALIGMPLVIGYTVFIYRVFRGKVRLDENSY